MGKLTNLNPSKPLTEADMPPGMATDGETREAITAHEGATDPHSQYLLESEGDTRYRQVGTQQIFTPTVKSIGRSTGGIATPSGTTANQCGNEVQASNASSAAFMSFHRPGSWAVHFGLDISNQLCVGGFSLGNVSYRILHEGIANTAKAPLPTASVAGNSVVLSWNSVQPGQGIGELCNYAGLGGGDTLNFFRMPGNADATPTISNRVSRIDIGGAYIATSDERVKSDFSEPGGLEIILKLSPQKYKHWNCLGFDEKNKTLKLGKSYTEKIGFLAQSVQKVLPEAVSTPLSEQELYGIDYNCILACAVRAIQEQQHEITKLQAQLQAISK
jgi:hypothetical protein